jgi:hypothetical protein
MSSAPASRAVAFRPRTDGRPWIVAVVAVAVVGFTTAALAGWGGGAPPGATGAFGPFLLTNASHDIGLSFPDCSLVLVHWSVVTGPSANFSVWPPAAVVATTCTGLPPSNATCPVSVCKTTSLGPWPVCFETGAEGSCTFVAAQTGYSFVLYPVCLSRGSACLPTLGNLTVTFTAIYT